MVIKMAKSNEKKDMICPHCGSDITVSTPDEHVWKCLDCGKRFTIEVKVPEPSDDDWEKDFPDKDETDNDEDDFSWDDDWNEQNDDEEEEEDFLLVDEED